MFDIINKWNAVRNDASEYQIPVYVIVDIGGTRVRIVLVSASNITDYQKIDSFDCHDVTTLINKIHTQLNLVWKNVGNLHVTKACLSVAGNIHHHYLTLADYSENDCILYKKNLNHKFFPSHHTYYLNAMSSVSLGLLHFSNKLDQYFNRFHGQNHNIIGDRTLIVYPGTSLKCGLLKGKDIMPLQCGHLLLPTDDHAFLEYLKKNNKGQYPVYDTICSGRGLELAYSWLKTGMDGKPTVTVDKIIAGMAVDPVAKQALHTYHCYLMRFLQNIAIAFNCHHIIVLGNNQVTNNWIWTKNREQYLKIFFDHEMKEELQNTNIWKQHSKCNYHILGCLYHLGTQN